MFSFEAIGHIRSCFQQKFGIPRQPRLAPHATAVLELCPPYNHPDSVRELTQFSHVWIVFVFHQTLEEGWGALVRPPKLGGKTRVGVFASRATHRPNPIGLSAVELLGVEHDADGTRLLLGGVDLLDGTPVLDIKPYLPYADSLPEAKGGYALAVPPPLSCQWYPSALAGLAQLQTTHPQLQALVEEILQQDPRPGYQSDHVRVYGIRLTMCDVQWRIDGDCIHVVDLQPLSAAVDA